METNKQDWQEQAQALIKNFRTKAKDTNRFVDLEDMAVHVGEEIKNLILQGAVSDKGDGRDLPLPEEMPKMKSKGSKKKRLESRAGDIVLERRGYQIPNGGYYYPLDYLLEIHCFDGQSPELKKDLALLGAYMPYRKAVEVCKRFRPNAPSHVTFQKCTRLVTKSPIAALRSSSKLSLTSSQLKFFGTRKPCSERFRDKSTNQVGEASKKVEIRCLDKSQNILHLSFQVDGGRINTKDGWRETKTAIVENGSDLIQMTKIQEHDQFINEFTCIIEKQGYDKYPVNKALISDGAKWIGDDFGKIYPDIVQILDYPHLKEHFFDTAKILHGENETEKNEKWVNQHLDLCFKDDIKKLLSKINRAKEKTNKRSKKHEALRLLYGYVETNQNRITYKTFLDLGLPIGSGRIEATIKQVNSTRMKSASIVWRLDNAQKLLSLRSTIFNGQFAQIKVA